MGIDYESLSSRAFLITRGSGAIFLRLKMPNDTRKELSSSSHCCRKGRQLWKFHALTDSVSYFKNIF